MLRVLDSRYLTYDIARPEAHGLMPWINGPRGYKTFFVLNSVEHESFSANKKLLLAFSYLLAVKISCSAIFSKKEFAIVNNLRFISRTNFMLRWVEHEKSFITSGPDVGSITGIYLTINIMLRHHKISISPLSYHSISENRDMQYYMLFAEFSDFSFVSSISGNLLVFVNLEYCINISVFN